MPPVVRLDTLQECRGRKTSKGWEWDRGAIVTGVTASNPWDICKAAASATGMPALGDAWPSEPDSGESQIYVTEITPERIDSDKVRFRIHYAPPDPLNGAGIDYVQWQIRGSLAQVETNLDVNGNVVSVEYTYPSSNTDPNYPWDNEKLAGQTVEVSDMRSVLRPEQVLIARRTRTTSPLSVLRTYIGKVNASGWLVDSTAAARTWLCEDISYESQYGGIRWIETYQFRWRLGGWDGRATYINRGTGQPPSDLVEGTGMKDVQDYAEADFNGLNLLSAI